MGFQVAGLAVVSVVCFSLKASVVVMSDIIVSAAIYSSYEVEIIPCFTISG